MTRSAARLVVKGRVQGVGYRWWTVKAATELGLSGWVRNCRDGSVEILAIGDDDSIGQLARACWKGPPQAQVRSVDTHPAADDGSSDFVQRGEASGP
jgi:acylphosphatase